MTFSKRHIFFILFFLLLHFVNLNNLLLAQGNTTLTVTGIVLDEESEPLIGVNIKVQGTAKGTVSDYDGSFEIHDLLPNSVLEFSYIGFEITIVAVEGRTILNIVLRPDTEMIEEIVVVGYSAQKKSDITGSVTSVDIGSFTKSVSPFATQSLQGLSSGVNVTANTGAPGEGAQIRIRGIGSITGNNSPLYIVDGVPTKNALDYLSSSDIEKISVLKDAASSAIYGSRANNGVVIITTKKGSVGQGSKISFSTQYGIQRVTRLTEMTNRDEYIQVYNEAAINDNKLLPPDQQILHRKLIDAEYAKTLPDIDHLASIFQTAPMQQYHLGFSGKTEHSFYNISGGYFSQKGILLGSDYNKLNAKISVGSEVTSWLDVGINANIYNDNNQIVGSSGDGFGGNGGSAIRYAFFRTSAIPTYDENGGYVDLPDFPSFFGDGYNPVGILEYHIDNNRKINGLFGDINFKTHFTDRLFLTSTFGLDRSNSTQRRINRTWGTSNRINSINSLNVAVNSISNWSISNVLNYRFAIDNDHSFTALLGTEAIRNNTKYINSSDRDFADQNDVLVKLGNGKGIKTNSEAIDENKLLSYFGRVNYSNQGKYFASALLRTDGSSRFVEGNRWGLFYSGSLGWRIDKEDFFRNNLISKMMLRVGYGSVGDQEIPNFAFLELVGSGYNYPFGENTELGNAITSFGNDELQWATSNQIDVGLDVGLLDDKWVFNFDYFRKITENMLLQISIPSSGGYAEAPVINTGKVLNTGCEAEIEYRNLLSSSLFYSIKANATVMKNEVLELESPILAGRIDNGVFATKTEVGMPIGSFYLYEMEGIFQNETEIFTHAFQGENILPGDVKYKDQNGDGFINDLDRTHVGDPAPDLTFGLSGSIDYKGFDISLFAFGAFGRKIYQQIATDIEGFYRPFNLTKRYYDERWTGENTSDTQPRASWSAKANNTRPSTRFLENGSFVRLKNVQIGYNFDNALTQKIGLDQFRLYASVSNLLTITKYPGLDPEFSTSDNSAAEGDLAAGIDWGTYPSAQTYLVGVQIVF
jgi:TonB-linked SusC/RagA family outer membrane protein